MNDAFKNKVIVVTGGTEGFGLHLVKNFLHLGGNVIFCSRTKNRVENIGKKLSSTLTANQKIIPIIADISNEQDVKMLYSIAIKEFSKIDVLVNNAGIYGPIGPLEQINWDDWLEALNVNLIGSILTVKNIIPIFKAQNKGKIIQISGGGATNPMPNFSSYAVSKTGIVRFVETISSELKEFNIDINAISPGALNTKMLDDVLKANPKKVGKDFYEKSILQKKKGGAGFEKGTELINFLASSASDGITGKIISALWDNYKDWLKDLASISDSDVYTLRRIVGRDRNLDWGDK